MKYLSEFLKSDIMVKVVPMKNDSRARNTIYTKVPTIRQNLFYILVNDYIQGEFIPPEKFHTGSYAYKGLYDTNTKTLYVNYESSIVKEVNCIVLNELNELVSSQVRDAIVAKVNNDVNTFNSEDAPEINMDYIKEKAKDYYISGSKAEYNYNDYYINFIDNPSQLVYYIELQDIFIDNKAGMFIRHNSERIYANIVKTDMINKEIQRLEETQELDYLRRIGEVLKDSSRKNYTVRYSMDDKGMTFKLSAEDLRIALNHRSLSYWCIQDKEDQRKYRDNYGYSNIEIDGVKSLTYGKKVLFSA